MSYLFISYNVASKLDFSKSTFSDRLSKYVLANLAFVWSKFYICGLCCSHESYLIRVWDSSFVNGCSFGLHLFRTTVFTLQSMRRHNGLTTLEKIHHCTICVRQQLLPSMVDRVSIVCCMHVWNSSLWQQQIVSLPWCNAYRTYWIRQWAELCSHSLDIIASLLIGITSLTVTHDGIGLRRVEYELRLLVEHVTFDVAIFNSNACPLV